MPKEGLKTVFGSPPWSIVKNMMHVSALCRFHTVSIVSPSCDVIPQYGVSTP